LHWVEVDYPTIIDYKERLLGSEKPAVKLEHIALDLANIEERRKLFDRLNANSRCALVLTEGVVPYLTEEQVASLAEDLHAQKNFPFWIAEYYAPEIYRYFKNRRRNEQMKNAPFRFFPTDWFGFFRSHGWVPQEVNYLPEEAVKVGRRMPMPWWARLLVPFIPKAKATTFLKQMGYVIYVKQ
jgi:O-methyltransferase involved in polyketide biosynthesis